MGVDTMRKQLMEGILTIVIFACLFAVVFPYVLLWLTDPFPRRLAFSVLFSLIALEKNLQTFLHGRTRQVYKVGHDITTITIGLTYPSVIYLALIEFYWKKGVPFSPLVTAAGLLLLMAGIWLRYWSFHHLGKQWAVHVDVGPGEERSLITNGPYRYIRHPIYAGAILEAVGIPLLFNSYGAFLLACMAFVPLEIHRAYYEERFLHKTFGKEYGAYRLHTWAFFPIPFRKPFSQRKIDHE